MRPVTFILCNKSDLAAPLIIVLDVLVNIGQVFIRLFVIRLPFETINRQILGRRATCRCPIAFCIYDPHGAIQNGQRFQVVAGAEHNRPHFGDGCGDHHIFQSRGRRKGTVAHACKGRGEADLLQAGQVRKELRLRRARDTLADHQLLDLRNKRCPRRIIPGLIQLGIPCNVAFAADSKRFCILVKNPENIVAANNEAAACRCVIVKRDKVDFLRIAVWTISVLPLNVLIEGGVFVFVVIRITITIDGQVGRKFIPRLIAVRTCRPITGCRCPECTVLYNKRFQIGAVAEYDIAHGDELFRKSDGFQPPTRGEGSAVQFCECRGELNVFQVCKARKNLDFGCPGNAFVDHKVLNLRLIVVPRRIFATLVTSGAVIPVDVTGSRDGQCLGVLIKCPIDLAVGSFSVFDQAALGSFRVIQSNKLDRTVVVFVLPLDIPIEIRQIIF